MGKRNKISAVKNSIDRAVYQLKSRMISVEEGDAEIIEKYNIVIGVEYDIKDDFFKEVEIMEITVEHGDLDRNYPNVESYIFKALDDEAMRLNRESETAYLESIPERERKEYFEWMAS